MLQHLHKQSDGCSKNYVLAYSVLVLAIYCFTFTYVCVQCLLDSRRVL